MNRSHLPLQALRCFDAAARHQSFKLAADELCLTPSAISHQIRHLEDWLGSALFLRKTRQVELTAMGRSLFDEVSTAFRSLESSLQRVLSQGRKNTLRLALPEVLAQVLQRDFIEAFVHANPQYGLELITIPNAMSAPHLDILQTADVAILLGTGFWEKARSYPLISLHISAFCPARLACHPFPLKDPRQLAEYHWLHNAEFPGAWGWFLSFLGLSGLQSEQGAKTYRNLAALLDPAFATEGIALVDINIAPYALGGEWQRMLDLAAASAAYSLVCPDNEEAVRRTKDLVEFFTAQAQRLGWPANF